VSKKRKEADDRENEKQDENDDEEFNDQPVLRHSRMYPTFWNSIPALSSSSGV
jgi:hypothetical protein